MRTILPVSFLLLLFSTAIVHAEGFKVVVHKSNPTSALSKGEIAALLMKKKTQWNDGTPALPIDQIESSKARASFSADILRKKPEAVKSYWRQQIFAGNAAPPAEMKGDAEIVAYVRANRGAIGYVSDTASVEDVKVVEVR